MSTHIKTLDTKCSCGTNLIEYHMKNPFIDDFTEECPKCSPGEAMNRLNSWSRSAARAEQDDEREYHEEENDE